VIPGDWQIVSMSALALLIVVGSLIVFRPRKRNRHVTLPPPSPACKRNSLEAVTK
jgi:hypothetical protein